MSFAQRPLSASTQHAEENSSSALLAGKPGAAGGKPSSLLGQQASKRRCVRR